MKNMIENTKTKVPSGSDMNDKDYLSDLLETEKNLVNNYSYALNEASNETYYDSILPIFLEISSIQRELFETMFKNGWYNVEKAENKKISSKHKEYKTEFGEI